MKRRSLQHTRYASERAKKYTKRLSDCVSLNDSIEIDAEHHLKTAKVLLKKLPKNATLERTKSTISSLQSSQVVPTTDLSEMSAVVEMSSPECSGSALICEDDTKEKHFDVECSQYSGLRAWLNCVVTDNEDENSQYKIIPIVRRPVNTCRRKNNFMSDEDQPSCSGEQSSVKNVSRLINDKAANVTPVVLQHTTYSHGCSNTSTPTSCSSANAVENREDDMFGFESLLKPSLCMPTIQKECTLPPMPCENTDSSSENIIFKAHNQQLKKKPMRYDYSILSSSYVLSKSKQSNTVSKTRLCTHKENSEILLFDECREILDDNIQKKDLNDNGVFEFPVEKTEKKVNQNKSKKHSSKTFAHRKRHLHMEPDLPWQEIMDHRLVIE